MQNANNRGVLLIGHGTRNPAGVVQFFDLYRSLADRLAPVPVELAFLELQQPDIHRAALRLLERGVRELTVMPLLLFAAGHVKRDIPGAVREAVRASKAGSVAVVQAGHLGLHTAVVELSQRRMEEALLGRGDVPPKDCCLLLAGRGSGDESATREMFEFASLRQRMTGGMHTQVSFAALARPSITDQVQRLVGSAYRRVIVQPHLLFAGEIADGIAAQVAAAGAENPRQEWLLTPLLADPPDACEAATQLLIEAICDRLQEAGLAG